MERCLRPVACARDSQWLDFPGRATQLAHTTFPQKVQLTNARSPSDDDIRLCPSHFWSFVLYGGADLHVLDQCGETWVFFPQRTLTLHRHGLIIFRKIMVETRSPGAEPRALRTRAHAHAAVKNNSLLHRGVKLCRQTIDRPDNGGILACSCLAAELCLRENGGGKAFAIRCFQSRSVWPLASHMQVLC